jgi:hypothetical protein
MGMQQLFITVGRRMLCAAVVAATPVTAFAACDWSPDLVSFLVASEHVGLKDFGSAVVPSDDTPGAFLTWECNAFDWTAGVFRNSYGDTSLALMASYDVIDTAWIEAGPFLGVANYPEHADLQVISYGDIVPLVGLQLRSGNLFVNVLPGDFKNVDWVLATGLTFEFGGQ